LFLLFCFLFCFLFPFVLISLTAHTHTQVATTLQARRDRDEAFFIIMFSGFIRSFVLISLTTHAHTHSHRLRQRCRRVVIGTKSFFLSVFVFVLLLFDSSSFVVKLSNHATQVVTTLQARRERDEAVDSATTSASTAADALSLRKSADNERDVAAGVGSGFICVLFTSALVAFLCFFFCCFAP
jgi:hypothetical protein